MNAGRPRTLAPDTVTTNVRLPRTLLDRLDRIANDRVISRAFIIERAITDLVERLEAQTAEQALR